MVLDNAAKSRMEADFDELLKDMLDYNDFVNSMEFSIDDLEVELNISIDDSKEEWGSKLFSKYVERIMEQCYDGDAPTFCVFKNCFQFPQSNMNSAMQFEFTLFGLFPDDMDGLFEQFSNRVVAEALKYGKKHADEVVGYIDIISSHFKRLQQDEEDRAKGIRSDSDIAKAYDYGF